MGTVEYFESVDNGDLGFLIFQGTFECSVFPMNVSTCDTSNVVKVLPTSTESELLVSKAEV